MDEKRTVNGFEVLFSMHVGPREVLFLLDQDSTEMPYMVGYCDIMPGQGCEQLNEVVGGDDYLEAMEEFLQRVQGQVAQVRAERNRTNEPQEVLGREHCLPSDGTEPDLHGRVVVIRPDALRPEYRNAAQQTVFVTGGFGAAPNARGRAVFGTNVFFGEKSDWWREDVLGILDPAKAPAWVKPGVAAIREQAKPQPKKKGGKPHELS